MTTTSRPRCSFRPCIESLEDRLAPANIAVTNLNDAGAGSLRQALIDLNVLDAQQNPANTIDLANAPAGAIALMTALPEIQRNVEIIGKGQNVTSVVRSNNANRLFRVFLVGTDRTVTIRDMTISNGRSAFGAGVYNSGTLALNRVTISGNQVTAGPGLGGGVYSHGPSLTITNSRITGNSTSNLGGGVYIDGGTSRIQNTDITANRADGRGGGLIIVAGSLDLDTSRITGINSAGAGGGGLSIEKMGPIDTTVSARSTTTPWTPTGTT